MNGETVDLAAASSDGYACLDRVWQKGDSIRLSLEQNNERLYAYPAVRQDVGRTALKRGPILYCVEETDNFDRLQRVSVSKSAKVDAAFEPDLLGGVATLSVRATADAVDDWNGALYRTAPPSTSRRTIKAVPYFAWDNRGAGEMLVWLRSS